MQLLSSQIIRNDDEGKGHYGASRYHGTHKGVDFVVTPGQVIKAPESGYIKRIKNPSAKDSRQHGFLFIGDSGLEVTVFYADLTAAVGEVVKKGNKIAIAQDISALYGLPDMKPHIHVETVKDGVRFDPMEVFTDTSKKKS